MMSFSHRVGVDEMQRCVDEAKGFVADMEPGFRLLTDLSNLEFMDASCALYIGQIMDLCAAKGVAEVVRVVPDPHKDIGFALIELFHYGKQINVVTYEKMEDAVQSLVA
jgi:anti-anti-sigma regulatory factor